MHVFFLGGGGKGGENPTFWVKNWYSRTGGRRGEWRGASGAEYNKVIYTSTFDRQRRKLQISVFVKTDEWILRAISDVK